MKYPVRNLARRISPSLFAFLKVVWLALDKNSFLVTSGLLDSYKKDVPCKPDGTPLPWMNYNVIALLDERLNEGLRLFEYGSGYSTLYFASRVANVVSVESEKQWIDRLRAGLPSNVELLYRPLKDGDQYCQSILECGLEFDVVVIDGRERVRCSRAACQALSPTGVILFDDTHRKAYTPGIQHLVQMGFKRLDLIGFKPNGVRMDRTSIFYRQENCLDL